MDLFGRRWAMRVLWELREPAPSYRALQARCEEISSSVLWQRVRELREARFVEASEGGGLRLTPLGEELLRRFLPLNELAEDWARRLEG